MVPDVKSTVSQSAQYQIGVLLGILDNQEFDGLARLLVLTCRGDDGRRGGVNRWRNGRHHQERLPAARIVFGRRFRRDIQGDYSLE